MTALSHRNILITGAAGGLGSAAALALASEGANIILLDKKIPPLEALYDKIEASGSAQAAIYPFDLSGANEQEYLQMAATIEEKYGCLHGLLHCAVDSGIAEPISQTKTLNWAQTMNINLHVPFLISKVLLPAMLKSPHATMIFVSDSAVRKAKAYIGAYGIAKIALEAFSSTLADELEAQGKIRVNTLVPGPINSPLRKRTYPAENKSELATPDSLTDLITFLFSDSSIGMTGQTIHAETFTVPESINT